jgi:hypothetical protein
VTVSATGGTGSYTGTGTFTVAAGNYTYTVSDANGCTSTTTINVAQPTLLVASSAVSTSIACNGGNAVVTVSATGGTGSYTGTGTFTVAAGNYTYTVSDANGCTTTTTITITQPSPLSLTTTVTDASCFGNTNGAVSLTVNGGTSAYTYSWSNGATTQNLSNVGAGTYSVLVTDANGCTSSASATVNQPAVYVLTHTVTNVNCYGQSTGAIDFNVTGGVTPYIYNWSNGATTQDLSNLAAGVYNVSVTCSSGCIVTTSITISQPSAPVALSGTVTNVICYGNANGSIDLNVTGGTSPYTYLWNNGSTTQDLSGLSAGVYSVVVNDVRGCSSNVSYTVSEPGQLNSTSIAGVISCYGGVTTVTISATGGTAPYTGTGTFTVIAGNYTYTVTDSKGCASTTTISVTQPNVITPVITGTNVTCFGNNNGTASVSTTGGVSPYSYSWSSGASTTSTANNLFAGNISVTVTDANGCSITTSLTITQPAPLTASVVGSTPVKCSGGYDGDADITVSGGTSPYTYLWSNGATTEDLVNVGSGTYTLTVTDLKGCTSTLTVTITQAPQLLAYANYSPINCFGGTTTVSVTASGGTPTYTGTGTYTVSAGTYTYSIIDANGCTAVTSIVVAQPSDLSVIITPTNASCLGSSDASASATVTGGTSPYTYSWSNGATTYSVNNLAVGNYTLTVTDFKGCTKTSTVAVANPVPLSVTSTYSNVSCFNGSDAVINLNTTGGYSPYSYSWSNGATSSSINGLATGNYSVTVTDSRGCSTTYSVNITQPTEILLSETHVNASCAGANGSIDLTVSGGTPAYTYSWSNGATTQDLVNVAGGIYSVTVTDSKGCIKVISVSVGSTGGSISAISGPEVVCSFINSGTLVKYEITTPCGVPDSIRWNIPSTGVTVASGSGYSTSLQVSFNSLFLQPSGTGQGVFSVIVYYGNTAFTSSIAVSAAPTKPLLSGSVCGNTITKNTYTVTPIAGANSYNWTVPFGSSIVSGQGSPTLVVKFSTNYFSGPLTVVATNTCGTSPSASLSLIKTPVSPAQIIGSNTVCLGTQNGGLLYRVDSVPLATYYIWGVPNSSSLVAGQLNDTAKVLFNSVFGSGNITIMAANQCGSSAMINFPVSTTTVIPTGPISGPTNVCSYLTGGVATYSVATVAGALSYNWSPPAGATITGGLGTNVITMTFANNFILGNLQVTVSNICGSSAPTQLALSLTNTFAVGTISGPTDVCSYMGSSANYSVALVPGASTYSWTAPAGCSILSGNGTNSVQISYPNGFITGTVSVAVASYCGSGSTSQSLAVSTIPSDPGSINGVACVTLGNSNAYNISPVVGATSYSWTVPNGASIVSGQGTTNANIMFGSSFNSGTVSVVAFNNCTVSSNASQKVIGIAAEIPAQIYGPTIVCSVMGTTNTVTYYVSPSPGASSYIWGMPPTAVIMSGQGTNSITVKYNSTFVAGNMSCMSVTGCGSSAMRYLYISNSPSNSNTNPISGLTNVFSIVGTGTTTSYSTALIPGVNSYSWTGTSGINIISGQGSNNVNISFANGYTSGTVTAMATTTCGNANPATIVIIATPPALSNSGSGSVTALTIAGLDTKDATCYGYNDGSANLQVLGGTAPYTFELNGRLVINTEEFSNLSAGDYTVKVKDSQGMTSLSQFKISEPNKLKTKTLIISTPSYQVLNDGHAVISAKGGTGNYSYSWFNENGVVMSEQEIKNLAPGNYTTTVLDQNNCSSIMEIVVKEKENALSTDNNVALIVYPVPASNELFIEFDKASEDNYLLQIVSVDGKVVYNEIVMPNFDSKTALNTTVWADGSYFITLINQNGTTVLSKKIIVQH